MKKICFHLFTPVWNMFWPMQYRDSHLKNRRSTMANILIFLKLHIIWYYFHFCQIHTYVSADFRVQMYKSKMILKICENFQYALKKNIWNNTIQNRKLWFFLFHTKILNNFWFLGPVCMVCVCPIEPRYQFSALKFHALGWLPYFEWMG